MVDILLISLDHDLNSIGVRSITAYLKKLNYKPAILFLPNFVESDDRSLREIVLLVKSLNPELVGISFTSSMKEKAINLTKSIRLNTKMPVIWGGIHATVCPEECLEFSDMVCVGDGEIAVSKLLENKKRGVTNFSEGVENIWFRDKKNKIIKNPTYIPAENYDFLPFLDYSLEDNYVYTNGKILELSEDLVYRYLISKYPDLQKAMYFIPTNRGCKFNCSYCANALYNKIYGSHNRKRGYSINRIISELEYVKKHLTLFGKIAIVDLDFLQNSLDWIQEFSNEYSKKVVLPFNIMASLDNFSFDKIKPLMQAGLYQCEIGLQSLSKRLNLEIYNRNFEINKLLSIIKNAKDLKDLAITFDFLINNPYNRIYDRVESFINSLKIAKALIRNKLKYVFTFRELQFFPGTKIAEVAKKDKRLRPITTHFRSCRIKNWIVLGPLFYFPFIPEKFPRTFLILLHRARKKIKDIYRTFLNFKN